MQRTRKVSETINRGVTAAAMTMAIATIYAAVTTDGRVSSRTILENHLETALKLYRPELQITQEAQDSQESLNALLLSSRDHAHNR